MMFLFGGGGGWGRADARNVAVRWEKVWQRRCPMQKAVNVGYPRPTSMQGGGSTKGLANA